MTCPPDELIHHAEQFRASGLLGKPGMLSRLFDFLLARSLEGDAPKETEIALQVFGKRPGFDVSQDAVVRVYVHKLRRRLEEFNARRSGSAKIVIPKGEYRLLLERPAARARSGAGNDSAGDRVARAGSVSASPLASRSSSARCSAWASAPAVRSGTCAKCETVRCGRRCSKTICRSRWSRQLLPARRSESADRSHRPAGTRVLHQFARGLSRSRRTESGADAALSQSRSHVSAGGERIRVAGRHAGARHCEAGARRPDVAARRECVEEQPRHLHRLRQRSRHAGGSRVRRVARVARQVVRRRRGHQDRSHLSQHRDGRGGRRRVSRVRIFFDVPRSGRESHRHHRRHARHRRNADCAEPVSAQRHPRAVQARRRRGGIRVAGGSSGRQPDRAAIPNAVRVCDERRQDLGRKD